MAKHSINRRSDVVTRVEGDETLVLDTQSNAAHCLSGDLAAVWNAGETSVAAVAGVTGLSADAVEHAVLTLDELGLVTAPAGLSRRTLVTRGAMVGGAVIASGAITVGLPSAAFAASGGGVTLTNTCPNPSGVSSFDFEEAGHLLSGPFTSYHAIIVYTSYDGDPSNPATLVEVARRIEFDFLSNGDGKPNGGFTGLNTSTVSPNDDKVTNISVGTAGAKGFLKMTTGYMFAGWATPTDTPPGPGPAAALTGLEGGLSLTGTNPPTSGNVYLQMVSNTNPTGDPHYAGYFNNVPCFQLT